LLWIDTSTNATWAPSTGPTGPTGPPGPSFPLRDQAANVNVIEYQTNVAGDTQPRFIIRSDGTIYWYNGASTGYNIGGIQTDYANTGNFQFVNNYGNIDCPTNAFSAQALGPNGSIAGGEVSGYTDWIGSSNLAGGGPPVSTSNSYQQGNIIMGRYGVGWFCIAGGSPGTWVPFGWGLPAPVTTGTTTQTYQDPTGQWWVAKAGVNGGQWRRATQVLHARWYRAAAWTAAASAWVNTTCDTMSYDDYGMYTTAGTGTFTPPCTGMWRLTYSAGVTGTAAGQWVQPGIWTVAGVEVCNSFMHIAAAYAALTITTSLRRITSLTDTYKTEVACSAALAGQVGTVAHYFEMDYVGT
jgi:hypothetical protein